MSGRPRLLNTDKGEVVLMLWEWPRIWHGWGQPKVQVFLAAFDFWVGGYWSKKSRTLYICPLPMLVVAFKFEARAGGRT